MLLTTSLKRAAVAIAALSAAVAVSETPANAQARPRIVNGVYTSDYPTTGALLQGTTFNSAGAWCTGTLIGCQTFLTAQHCVEGYTANDFKVFLQHGGMFNVASISVAPGYNFPEADVAVIRLGTPVTGIVPTAINTVMDPPFGTAGTIVGFGRSGGDNEDYGLKRAGAVTTAACSSPADDTTAVCWDYDASIGAPGTDSNTCNADSGGPLFMTLSGQDVVAGITSGGTLDSCLAGDSSYDADVFYYRSFIDSVAGADLGSTRCGDLTHVGEAGTSVTGVVGTVDGVTTQQLHTFSVPAGMQVLRVAMNAIEDGVSDFDFYVRQGVAPTTTVSDCSRTGGNQFGVCEFNAPVAGDWYVLVNRFGGGGTYQLTVTKFGPGCADPGNDGLPCDDQNPCTENDVCGALTCQGTAVTDGTVCGGGTLCSGSATCQAGTCAAGTATPRTGCLQSLNPPKSSISIRNKTTDTSDKLTWKWRSGEAVSDFGDPSASTDYALCIYDENAGTPTIVQQHQIPAGVNWTATGTGYKYSDSSLSSNGIRTVKLRTGIDTKASISVSGKGAGLGAAALPLTQDQQIIVQLVNSDGDCWENRFSSNTSNDNEDFKAKGDPLP